MAPTPTPRRRSVRLREANNGRASDAAAKTSKQRKTPAKRNRSTESASAKKKKSKAPRKAKVAKQKAPSKTKITDNTPCLPRDIEERVRKENDSVVSVLGIDEAGRGPLAGPVVAAAVIATKDLDGVVDSKKITKEEDRETLYEQLVAMKDIQWAVSVISAQRIDEINILQATLEGMRTSAIALISPNRVPLTLVSEASISQSGSYVVASESLRHQIDGKKQKKDAKQTEVAEKDGRFYALIDGNKVPKEMPCEAEAVVKGDSKEFSIAAASILAKVTRDRLMHGYDGLYPQYNLKQHKGYPTAQHMKAVFEHGASPIHRRTFAPLKHMQFDDDGKVIKPD